MEIVLAGKSGLAKDLLLAFRYDSNITNIAFFDNVSGDKEDLLYNKFKIINNLNELKEYFKSHTNLFITAIGSPRKRKKVSELLIEIGGVNISYISSESLISEFANISNKGVIIQLSCQVSSSVVIEEGVFINARGMIGHDCRIGKYTTLSPDVKLLGNVHVGENCVLATGVTVMPNVKIGNNVKIGMNKLVTENVPDDTQWF